MSLTIILTLVAGIIAGYFLPAGVGSIFETISSIMIILLIFSVGIEMGINRDALDKIKQMGLKIFMIPFGIIIGTLIGGAILSLFINETLKESLAISAGLGWYSLSGVLISEAGNAQAGIISFFANIFREVITFIAVPFIAKYINFYCAIAPAGATAMDTTLGVISRNTNGKITAIAFLTGITLTIFVPFLVSLFLH